MIFIRERGERLCVYLCVCRDRQADKHKERKKMIKWITRMHSIRMHTAHSLPYERSLSSGASIQRGLCLGVFVRGSLSGGSLPRGPLSRWSLSGGLCPGCLCPGESLSRGGLCLGVSVLGWHLCQGTSSPPDKDPLHPVDRMTDTLL